MAFFRIGYGYDTHIITNTLINKHGLMIGGVCVDKTRSAQAHSDGDVLLHALCDSLLGAAGMGDIGEHFPDTDPRYKDCDSAFFVEKCIKLIQNEGWEIVNLDTLVELEEPLLGKYKPEIRKVIAELTQIDKTKVNIKATRGEGAGAIGRGEALSARVVCLIQKTSD